MKKVRVLNLMQHKLTAAQVNELESGVPSGMSLEIVSGKEEIEFFPSLANTPGDWQAICELARRLAVEIVNTKYAKIILPVGSPAFQFALGLQFASLCRNGGIDFDSPEIIWAHSVRSSTEERNADGSVTKKMVFNHAGFYGETCWNIAEEMK